MALMEKILPRLSGPADLQGLPPAAWPRLAEELRQTIIETVSQNGGHLAASLGAVELTMALHLAFESPRDRIVWDTGHQAYAHKLLTGRLKQFPTLRRAGGLSGFLKRRESPHDAWEAGHAGTAISAALGFARARDLQGKDHTVVAVVGDGALTSGMAYEALNNAGAARTRMVVVLNDNSMSISSNVGAISSYLAHLRAGPAYLRLKEDLMRLLERIPGFGSSMAKTAERLKDGLKCFLLPGMLFEELGFTYLGPVDGHDVAALLGVLKDARRVEGPVLVHAITQKGRGYAPAEVQPEKFHGTGPFVPETGKAVAAAPGAALAPITYTAAFSRALVRLAAERPEVVAITAAMPEGTGLSAFERVYPARFFDVGIAEQHAVTFAAGLASAGLHPVVAIYSTFLQRAYDQVVHDVCLQNLPVVFALDRAGLVGADGETHQGAYDLAYLRHIPGMSVMVPKDENELAAMLATALDARGPVAIRYPRGAGVGVVMEEAPRPVHWGKAEVLRDGADVAIVAVGPLVYQALEAADILAEAGVAASVVNARFVKPLDEERLAGLAFSTRAVVTVEEHAAQGGFGSALLEVLAARGVRDVPVKVLGLPDAFVEQGEREAILSSLGLDVAGIVRAVLEVLGPWGAARNARRSRKEPSGDGFDRAREGVGRIG